MDCTLVRLLEAAEHRSDCRGENGMRLVCLLTEVIEHQGDAGIVFFQQQILSDVENCGGMVIEEAFECRWDKERS